MKRKNRTAALMLILILLLSLIGSPVLAASHEAAQPSVDNAAVDFRSEMDHLLSEHGFTTLAALTKLFAEEPDAEQARDATLQNAEDLTAVMASLFGEEAAAAFSESWNAHLNAFMDYANGAKAGDQQAMQDAKARLTELARQMGTHQEQLTEGRVPAAAFTELMIQHEEQVAAAFDAFAAGDYPSFYTLQSEGLAFLVDSVSKTLSDAYTDQFSDRFGGAESLTNAANLRSDLNYMLGEHFALAGQVLQKRFLNAPDFEASLQALHANTEKLTAAIASIYGEEAAAAFAELWTSHNEYYLQYAEATMNGDAAGKDAAIAGLAEFKESFSAFMSEATDGILSAEAVAEGLQVHADTTLGTFDRFAAEDYAGAWGTAREGYAHMFEMAKLFSAAFVQQFPDQFAGVPAMPQTGFGGMAEENGLTALLWSLPFLIIAAVIVFSRRQPAGA